MKKLKIILLLLFCNIFIANSQTFDKDPIPFQEFEKSLNDFNYLRAILFEYGLIFDREKSAYFTQPHESWSIKRKVDNDNIRNELLRLNYPVISLEFFYLNLSDGSKLSRIVFKLYKEQFSKYKEVFMQDIKKNLPLQQLHQYLDGSGNPTGYGLELFGNNTKITVDYSEEEFDYCFMFTCNSQYLI